MYTPTQQPPELSFHQKRPNLGPKLNIEASETEDLPLLACASANSSTTTRTELTPTVSAHVLKIMQSSSSLFQHLNKPQLQIVLEDSRILVEVALFKGVVNYT